MNKTVPTDRRANRTEFEVLGEWSVESGNQLMLKARRKTGYASIWLDCQGQPVKIGYALHASGVVREVRWEPPWAEQAEAWKSQQRAYIASLVAAWHAERPRSSGKPALPVSVVGTFDAWGFRFAVEPTAASEHAVLSVVNVEGGLTPVADLLHEDGRICGMATRPGWKGTPKTADAVGASKPRRFSPVPPAAAGSERFSLQRGRRVGGAPRPLLASLEVPMFTEQTALARRSSFFARITEAFTPAEAITTIAITHLLTERPAFIDAVAALGELAALLPKPKSLDQDTLATIATRHQVDELSRETFADPEHAVAYLEKRAPGQSLVLLDVGGYFAPSLSAIAERFSGRLLGIVEDTENGHQRYLAIDNPPCPVISVARSPLKQPEDHLVGQSCAFSAEALMRAVGDLPIGRPVAVLGFGKLGRAAAATLHDKGAVVRIFDTDPVRATQALASGYLVAASCAEAIAEAGLVLCATGNHALAFDDFTKLANGAHIATVTSSEDELDLAGLTDFYTATPVAEHVTRFETIGHYFYLHNGGNAVNFIHGAVVGPFIHLVQAEILAAAARLATSTLEPGHHELTAADRRRIAAIWLDYYRSNA
ncbi:hypothetical protein GCM10029992_10440 [Glycomyces albus]